MREARRNHRLTPKRLVPLLVVGSILVAVTCHARGAEEALLRQALAKARENYGMAYTRYTNEASSAEAAWQYGRACFDVAEYTATKKEQAEFAERGIRACQHSIALSSSNAPAHYYWGMNLGQVARTKGFGALSIVGQIRDQFELARRLDETFDRAGPDRNLGYLFRDTPSLLSIGDRRKAQFHLERAVEIAPEHPENWLALIEGRLNWGQREKADEAFNRLDKIWPEARARLTGPFWAVAWEKWEILREKLKRRLGK